MNIRLGERERERDIEYVKLDLIQYTKFRNNIAIQFEKILILLNVTEFPVYQLPYKRRPCDV